MKTEYKPRQNRVLVVRRHQAVAREIGISILKGDIQPGQSLGTELDQAPVYNVSRSAYREALRILTGKGLLESRPKSGTRVTERQHWNKFDPDILEWSFDGAPDHRFVLDLFELRQLIEPSAASLAAERRSAKDMADIDLHLATMRSETLTTERGQAADRDFHSAILTATGNEVLQSLSNSIGAAVRWTTHFKHAQRKITQDSIPLHARLRDAIALGDPSAARIAMEDLISASLDDMGISRMSRAGG